MIRRTLANTKAATFCVELVDIALLGMPAPAGTGFFVSADGWFITAAHVITENNQSDGPPRQDIDQAWLMQETRIDGNAPGGMCQHVSLGHILPAFDIALLKVDFAANAQKEWLRPRSGFPHLTVSSRELDEGEPVYAFGYPLSGASAAPFSGGVSGTSSLCPRVTSAIVSSTLEHSTMVMASNDAKVYVLDKALNYGNSGGPIVSSDTGRVHAVCSRFQPLQLQQNHVKVSSGDPLVIVVPSLYGVVASLGNAAVLQLFGSLGIPVDGS